MENGGELRHLPERAATGKRKSKMIHDEMEIGIRRRTAELTQANEALQAEIAELKRREVELLKAKDEAEKHAERLELALKGSNDAIWEWDMISDQGLVNERHYEMTGYSPGEVDINFDFFINGIHPDDVFEVVQLATEYLEGKTDMFEAQYRMITKTGQIRHVIRRGKIVSRDENGNPLKMAGVVTDITNRKRLDDEA
jgi:PAS domain S-box-containing protein